MAAVNVLNVRYLNGNPCPATELLRFEIAMECVTPLDAKEVEWSMTYIGSAESNKHDQLLDSVIVDAPVARLQFVFEASAPNLFLVPKDDQLDVSAIILSAKYKDREFCRVGYYMRHEYPQVFVDSLRPATEGISEVILPELPCGENLNLNVLQRNVYVDNPRVTNYIIDWDAPNEQLLPPPAATEEVPEEDLIGDDEEEEEEGEAEDEESQGSDEEMMDEDPRKGTPLATAETENISMAHE